MKTYQKNNSIFFKMASRHLGIPPSRVFLTTKMKYYSIYPKWHPAISASRHLGIPPSWWLLLKTYQKNNSIFFKMASRHLGIPPSRVFLTTKMKYYSIYPKWHPAISASCHLGIPPSRHPAISLKKTQKTNQFYVFQITYVRHHTDRIGP